MDNGFILESFAGRGRGMAPLLPQSAKGDPTSFWRFSTLARLKVSL